MSARSDFFDDFVRTETHFQGGKLGPNCVSLDTRQINCSDLAAPNASRSGRAPRRATSGGGGGGLSSGGGGNQLLRPAKHTARFTRSPGEGGGRGSPRGATRVGETAWVPPVAAPCGRPQTVPLELARPGTGLGPADAAAREMARDNSARGAARRPATATTQHERFLQRMQEAQAMTKDCLRFETLQERTQRIHATGGDGDARSFEINKRIYTGFVPIPMTTTTTSHYTGCDKRTFNTLHSDFKDTDNRRVKGHFTEYLRQSIKKNIDLKQTGHA